MNITKIYLSEEENEVLDYGSINTDVIVQLDNDYKYSAHFISIKKLTHDIEAHRKSTKDPSNKYYWSQNMVIVNDMDEKDLIPIIEHMIQEGDFQMIFKKLS